MDNIVNSAAFAGVNRSSWDIDSIGDDHLSSAEDTPMRIDALKWSRAEKIERIEGLFKEIMETLGLDLSDDSLRGTPRRVAKMFVNETFRGLDTANKPDITLFDNKYHYNQMVVEKDITFYSNCEHHFVPFFGKAHVAYISSGKVIGLSKLNRLVDYFARRPQVQERLTMQIGKALQAALATESVAVVMDASHMCVASRGIQDRTSSTVTSFYGGRFANTSVKEELLKYIGFSAHS